jgi:hypothetical protein
MIIVDGVLCDHFIRTRSLAGREHFRTLIRIAGFAGYAKDCTESKSKNRPLKNV